MTRRSKPHQHSSCSAKSRLGIQGTLWVSREGTPCLPRTRSVQNALSLVTSPSSNGYTSLKTGTALIASCVLRRSCHRRVDLRSQPLGRGPPSRVALRFVYLGHFKT